MQIIDNMIILLLIVGAFLGGLALAGMYWRRLIDEWRYTCKLLSAQNGVGYVAPPERKDGPITEHFMEHLHKNGRATTIINSKL